MATAATTYRPLSDLVALHGRIAVVTGGRGGMGKAIANLLCDAGAQVIAADLGEAPAEEEGRAGIAFMPLDVADPAQWAVLVARVEEDFGPISILVNCAGLFHLGAVEDTDPKQLDAMLGVNQAGPLFGIKAVTPSMKRAGGGAIVNIASGAAMRGFPGIAGYTMSKWGLRGLSRSAAAELAPYGIRVNAIHPGAIETPMLHVHSDAHIEAVRQKTPLQRTGTPEDIAKVVLFLVSDMASYVTGTDLPVDGGVLA